MAGKGEILILDETVCRTGIAEDLGAHAVAEHGISACITVLCFGVIGPDGREHPLNGLGLQNSDAMIDSAAAKHEHQLTEFFDADPEAAHGAEEGTVGADRVAGVIRAGVSVRKIIALRRPDAVHGIGIAGFIQLSIDGGKMFV